MQTLTPMQTEKMYFCNTYKGEPQVKDKYIKANKHLLYVWYFRLSENPSTDEISVTEESKFAKY